MFESADENRDFNPFPVFDPTYFEGFPEEFEAYFNDAFSFRAPLLDFHQYMKFKWFKISPYPDKVIIGNDGWLFNARKEAEILDGKLNFSEEQLAQFETEWDNRIRILDSLDIKVLWYILPMKHYVYLDKMPFTVRVSKPKRVKTLQERLNTSHPNLVHDPTQLLIHTKDSFDTYLKNDNHWNYRAGHSTSLDILQNIHRWYPNRDFSLPKNYTWEQNTFFGGCHAQVIGKPYAEELEWFVAVDSTKVREYKRCFLPPADFPYPDDYEHSFINPDGNGLKILIIGDSFSHPLQKFLPEVFSETVFIFDSWQYDLNLDVILEVQPDIVLFESLETHIDHFIENKTEPN